MVWLGYFDYSFYAALVCVFLGYCIFPVLGKSYGIAQYSTLLVGCVLGAAIVGFVLSFFGPIVFVSVVGGDTVMPAFASLYVGPFSAVLGLAGFCVYVFTHRRDD